MAPDWTGVVVCAFKCLLFTIRSLTLKTWSTKLQKVRSCAALFVTVHARFDRYIMKFSVSSFILTVFTVWFNGASINPG